MSEKWVKIYVDIYLYKIQIAQAVLEEHGIESVYINKQNSAYAQLFGDIELYTTKENALKAVNLLKNINYEEDESID